MDPRTLKEEASGSLVAGGDARVTHFRDPNGNVLGSLFGFPGPWLGTLGSLFGLHIDAIWGHLESIWSHLEASLSHILCQLTSPLNNMVSSDNAYWKCAFRRSESVRKSRVPLRGMCFVEARAFSYTHTQEVKR